MAIMDDLIAAGLSYPQALAVVGEDTVGDNTDGLVAAGFTTTEAIGMHAYDASKTAANLDNLVQQGIWAGPALTAIYNALNVTP
jgi:hypothetical protein